MIRKSVVCVFFFLFVFVVGSPVFSATSTTSGSGSKPEMKFDSWRVGRSPRGTNINSKEQKSFITSTGTSTYLAASVMYKGGRQPKNSGISPIDPDTVKWTLDEGLLKGWKLAEPPGTSWSGSHPSKLSGSTSFNVVAKFSFPAHSDTSYYTIAHSCGGNAARRSRRPKHRDGEPMKINVKFSAKTYSGASVSLTLPLSQDEIDQIRQEHVDYDRVIPSRGSFRDSDGDYSNFGHVFYDFGHYDKMIDAGLKGYQQKWVAKMNALYRKGKTALAMGDFTLNSAYRNPHHNFEHAKSKRSRLSPHMYGYALDIDGRDLDGISGADQQKMVDAAYAVEPRARFSQKYPDKTHVHADWAPGNWASRTKTNPAPPNDFKLAKQSTDKPAVVKKEEEKKANLLRCGHAEGSAGYHLQIGLRCGHKFWYCHGKIDEVLSAHRRFACPVNAEGEKCNVSGGYSHACTPHEHSYPETVSKAPEVPKQKPEVKPDPKPKIVPEEDDEDDDDDDEETPTPVDKDVLGACGIHTYKSSEASSKASLHV